MLSHFARVLALAALILFPLSACREDPAHPYSQTGITQQELLYHIRYLASDELRGRLAGTAGAERAARYIASEFQRYGLRPAGDDGGWSQTFEFVAGVKAGEYNHLSVTIGPQTTTYAIETDYLPLAFSSGDSATGDVVFVGYGITAPDINYDDYEGVDVTGKIVLMLRYSPEGTQTDGNFASYRSLRYKAMVAREKGAAGLLIVTGPESEDEDSLIRLRQDMSLIDSGIPGASITRSVATTILMAAGTTLKEAQRRINQGRQGAPFTIPSTRVMLRTDIEKDWQRTSNIIGFLDGVDRTIKDQVIVIGAHYDHLGLGGPSSLAPRDGEIHHGADDNASGTAGLLELAQVFTAHRKQLKRSLLFVAFSGEEEGLLGSNYYIKHPGVPLKKIAAMINLDMIGRQRDHALIVSGTGTALQWQGLLDQLNQSEFKLQLKADGYGPSDQASFYGQGIPVLFFFTGSHEDYHRPSDTAEKINIQGEREIVEYVYRVVNEIDQLSDPPVFARVQDGGNPAAVGSFRSYLGALPDYGKEEMDGVRLLGVGVGSPAEKAGLQKNDIIVGLGTRAVKNLYDYIYALQAQNPGDSIPIVIVRDGKRITLTVTLEQRR